jgi:hypothetical protein
MRRSDYWAAASLNAERAIDAGLRRDRGRKRSRSDEQRAQQSHG